LSENYIINSIYNDVNIYLCFNRYQSTRTMWKIKWQMDGYLW
jgi:hypothetical protein